MRRIHTSTLLVTCFVFAVEMCGVEVGGGWGFKTGGWRSSFFLFFSGMNFGGWFEHPIDGRWQLRSWWWWMWVVNPKSKVQAERDGWMHKCIRACEGFIEHLIWGVGWLVYLL